MAVPLSGMGLGGVPRYTSLNQVPLNPVLPTPDLREDPDLCRHGKIVGKVVAADVSEFCPSEARCGPWGHRKASDAEEPVPREVARGPGAHVRKRS